MANLKNIKNRINSITSTQKITRAMKMVASAKIKKTENRVKASRPFTYELTKLFYRALNSVRDIDTKGMKFDEPINNYPVLLKEREIKTVGLLVVTSNKGLCGAFNANLVRYTIKKVKEYKEKGINTRLFIIGQKGFASLKRQTNSVGFEIAQTYLNFPAAPNASCARVVANDMAEEFVENKVDSMEIVTTRFKNMMSYSVETWDILPLDDIEDDYVSEEHTDMTVEPDMPTILSELVPLYITNIIYQALLESVASELASKMTAMSAACNNADSMIKSLTVEYNKARQAQITQDIIEIVGGAESVRK
ncbi:ATP synthase F1 subunit gamma [bacterium]|nr:ATP synthase F1 subunit gamma [bacterium]